ncbi:MAG: DUF2207 domain-containing protein [Peptostreptococcaceae bacterium]|nr:DUF2207 domain-containing protein [Peptostreptococcaceae bacterium]
MKKWIQILLMSGLVFCGTFSGFAQENQMPETRIDIQMTLNDDGSVDILQKWKVLSAGKGQGYDLDIDVSDNMEVENFRLQDDTGVEYFLASSYENWETFTQKSFITQQSERGRTIRWGTNYEGIHKYEISYTITDAAKSYTDYDGLLMDLMSEYQFTDVQKVSVHIKKAGFKVKKGLEKEECRVYFSAGNEKVNFSDGQIHAGDWDWKPNKSLRVLLKLPKEFLHPAAKVDSDFESVMLREDSSYAAEKKPKETTVEKSEEPVVQSKEKKNGFNALHLILGFGFGFAAGYFLLKNKKNFLQKEKRSENKSIAVQDENQTMHREKPENTSETKAKIPSGKNKKRKKGKKRKK